MKTRQEALKVINWILNQGVSGDLDAVGCGDYNPQLAGKVLDLFIDFAEELAKECEGIKEFEKSLEQLREKKK